MKAFIFILHKKNITVVRKLTSKAMLKDRMRCSHNAFVCKNVLYQQLEASQHNKSILLDLFQAGSNLYFVHLSVHQALKG